MPVSVEDVYKDLDRFHKKQGQLHKEMREDVQFALGKQWKDEDKRSLEKAGVLPLTINQIKPILKIVTGIERQSRSDYVAFPEGKEDELTGEIVTKLLKNVVKRSSADKKLSSQFKEGIATGLCFIEPYIDYTHDLINGELKLKKINANRVFFDNGEEYDLSDRRAVIKVTYNLSKDELLELFPEDENKIDEVNIKRVDFKDIKGMVDKIQTRDYEFDDKNQVDGATKDDGYDLVEYYYKSPKTVFYLADKTTGQIQEFDTREEAEAAQGSLQSPEIIPKRIPEIKLKQLVGETEFSDDVAWSYPRHKSYPLIPFIAEWMDIDIDEPELLIQGIVRSLRDLQLELNKSRTLELRHLNSTANSGFMMPKGSVDPKTKDALKKFGSSPGFYGEFDVQKAGGVTSVESFRIRPAPLPQGHMALSSERINDIKQASGVNPDLLANDSQSQSGRAILLKQRQGLVMIQEALDNYGETKRILGRFILSQLGEIYTVESAIRVLGEAFIEEHFSRPQIDETGQPARDDNGNPIEQVDPKEVMLVINKILNDAAVGKFDVSIGEGAYSETVKFTNFMTLMEMVEKGVPIPPTVVVEESLLSESQKQKIVQAIEASQQQV